MICPIHQEKSFYICLNTSKIICSTCTNLLKHQSNFAIPMKLIQNFDFISVKGKEEKYIDCIAFNHITERKYIIRLFITNFEKELYWKKLSTINHPYVQKALKYSKTNILFEYFDEFEEYLKESCFFENSIDKYNDILAFLKQMIDVLDYLHNLEGIYHGNLCIDSINVSGGKIKLINMIFPFFPDNKQNIDIQNLGLILYQILNKEIFSLRNFTGILQIQKKINEKKILANEKETFLYEIIEKCIVNKWSINDLKTHLNSVAVKKNNYYSMKKIKHPLKYYSNSFGYLLDLQENFSLNFRISDEKLQLEDHLYKNALYFQNMTQNISLYKTLKNIESLKIFLKPSYSQVDANYNWRKFWWFSFYHENIKETSFRSEILLGIHSTDTDDW